MSNQPKHTPGPWRTGPQTPGTGAKNYCEAGTSVYAGPVREHDIGKRIALCHFEGSTAEERLANAQLIAAAPDLLAACESLLKFNEELCQDVNVSIHYPSAEKARAAIAKALGNRT